MKGRRGLFLLLACLLSPASFLFAAAPLVLQSDFGTKDGAVAAMKGVAVGVGPELRIYDLTHEIPAFNVWEGAYRLWQTAPYWPAGTVFVSVVDPGVGTARKSVVARAKNGQFFVTPDNGTLTLIAEHLGLDAVREIDEKTNRRPGSEASYTFHGRDVYAYTGARLAAGVITFEEVGPALDPAKLVTIPHDPVQVYAAAGYVVGGIPVLDPQYGNVWTDIDRESFARLGPAPRPGERFEVRIGRPTDEFIKAMSAPAAATYDGVSHVGVFSETIPYANSFGEVPVGQPLLYFNSLGNLSVALNEGSFAAKYQVRAGPGWTVTIKRLPTP